MVPSTLRGQKKITSVYFLFLWDFLQRTGAVSGQHGTSPLTVAAMNKYNLDAANHSHSGSFVYRPKSDSALAVPISPTLLLSPRSKFLPVYGPRFQDTRHQERPHLQLGGRSVRVCLGPEEPLLLANRKVVLLTRNRTDKPEPQNIRYAFASLLFRTAVDHSPASNLDLHFIYLFFLDLHCKRINRQSLGECHSDSFVFLCAYLTLNSSVHHRGITVTTRGMMKRTDGLGTGRPVDAPCPT